MVRIRNILLQERVPSIMGRWKTTLKDGREVVIRLLTRDDKDQLVEMFASMSEEALQWSMAPYSEKLIERWLNSFEHLIPLVAEFHDRIIGYSAIFKTPHPRMKGIADIGCYLHQDFHGVGLGTAMTKYLLDLGKNHNIHRLSLTVVEENTASIQLYKKFGFEIEGTKCDAYYGNDGKYHNILIMSKIL